MITALTSARAQGDIASFLSIPYVAALGDISTAFEQSYTYLLGARDIEAMKGLADQGVVFAACSNALKGQGIAADRLAPFVAVVPAGVRELADRQMEGYAYIKP